MHKRRAQNIPKSAALKERLSTELLINLYKSNATSKRKA